MRYEIKNEIHSGTHGIRGLYWFFGTFGLPLTEQFAKCLEYGLYPDWAYLWVEIAGNGWNDKRIYGYIAEEMEGVYPPDVAKTIRLGLARLLHQEVAA